MPVIISLTVACLFVFLAGFNVWNMLSGASAGNSKLWTRLHRLAGYCFLALFVVLCYFMLLRIKGFSDELPPRLVLHMGLALLLAPLLLVKVLVARNQRSARGLLTALGIGIFVVAFTLVAVNVLVHYLRVASANEAPLGVSITVIVVPLITAAIAYFRNTRHAKGSRDSGILPDHATAQELTNSGNPVDLILARIERQTNDARTLRFLLPRGRRLSVRPGQFMTFQWMIDGRPFTRSYSISSSPAQTGYIEITPKKVPNGYVSQFLNDRAKMGLTVSARGPYGRFYFDESKHERIVLIAGGSGITPMASIVRYIDDLCIPVDVTLIYCVRTSEDVIFNGDFAAIQRRVSNFRYLVVLSQPNSEWAGWKGHLRREIVIDEVKRPLESTFFLCGPPPFMEHSRAVLEEMGVESSRILQESFGGAAAGEKPATTAVGRLKLKFHRSNLAYTVSPAETLLESSEKNGMPIPSGCRQGTCGTCVTKLLNGEVRMACEDALSNDLRSQGFILPCVSLPLTDVTLDA